MEQVELAAQVVMQVILAQQGMQVTLVITVRPAMAVLAVLEAILVLVVAPVLFAVTELAEKGVPQDAVVFRVIQMVSLVSSVTEGPAAVAVFQVVAPAEKDEMGDVTAA